MVKQNNTVKLTESLSVYQNLFGNAFAFESYLRERSLFMIGVRSGGGISVRGLRDRAGFFSGVGSASESLSDDERISITDSFFEVNFFDAGTGSLTEVDDFFSGACRSPVGLVVAEDTDDTGGANGSS